MLKWSVKASNFDFLFLLYNGIGTKTWRKMQEEPKVWWEGSMYEKCFPCKWGLQYEPFVVWIQMYQHPFDTGETA